MSSISASKWAAMGAKDTVCILSAEDLADLGAAAPPETHYRPPPLKTKSTAGFDMRIGNRAKKRRREVHDIPIIKAAAAQGGHQQAGKLAPHSGAGRGGTAPSKLPKGGPKDGGARAEAKPPRAHRLARLAQESDLPAGWKVERRVKSGGESVGLICTAPDGRAFKSLKEAKASLAARPEPVLSLEMPHVLAWLRSVARQGRLTGAPLEDAKLAVMRARRARWCGELQA